LLLKILVPHGVGTVVLTAGGMMQWQKAKQGKFKWERGANRGFSAAGARPATGPALELVSPHHCSGLLPS